MKKEKQKISTVLLLSFLTVAFLLGAAIYGLSNYYFIDASLEFNPAASTQTVVAAKNKKLRLPDFSMFEGDKFNVLERGYWHVFDLNSFELGNNNPFERVLDEDGVK